MGNMNQKHKENQDIEDTRIKESLAALMKAKGIRESELARETGIPQPTLNRLLIGSTSNPTISTVEALTKFFGVTMEQLLGREPITSKRSVPSHMIPIISWRQAP